MSRPDSPTAKRAGNMHRVVDARDVSANCSCGRTFTNTGPAASHARSARHVVSVDYRTTFRYLPQEVTPAG